MDELQQLRQERDAVRRVAERLRSVVEACGCQTCLRCKYVAEADAVLWKEA